MKLVDTTVLLESFEEAYRVFFHPTAYDFAAGGDKCAFYAGVWELKLPESISLKLTVGFSSAAIEGYWCRLQECMDLFPGFDFNSGAECVNPDYPEIRDDSNPNLRVAKEIARRGFHQFTFEFYDDQKNCARVISVRRKDNQAIYTFEDVLDITMYDSLREWVDSQCDKEHELSLKSMADLFCMAQ